MNSYTTLLGESVDLNKIPISHRQLIDRLMSLEEGTKLRRRRAAEFVADARREIRRQFQVNRDYLRAMHGPIGAVYRDGFYRLLAKEVTSTPEEWVRFAKNLRFNPARILLDCFLICWDLQIEFAQAAGLDPGTVNRIFKYVLETDSDGPGDLSLARFRAACEKLGVVPLTHYIVSGAEAGELEPPLGFAPSSTTSREQILQVLVATVTKMWCAAVARKQHLHREVEEAFRRFVGLHLAALYGVEDIVVLNHMTDAFLRDIQSEPRIEFLGGIGSHGSEAEAALGQVLSMNLWSNYARCKTLVADARLQWLFDQFLIKDNGVGDHDSRSRLRTEGERESSTALAESIRAGWERVIGTYQRWVSFLRSRRRN